MHSLLRAGRGYPAPSEIPVSKARVELDAKESVAFAIGRNQAEALQALLLRAYRDQMAEVNHVHIEGEHDSHPFDLTLLFEVFAERNTRSTG